MRVRSLLLSAALLILPLSLRADTIYTYTGNPFTNFGGVGYTTSDFVSGSFTLSSPLAPNMVIYGSANAIPLSFSISDGYQTITNLTPGAHLGNFSFETDAAGSITGWNIFISAGISMIGSLNNVPGMPGIKHDFGTTTGSSPMGENSGTPGTWTVTSTDPAPAPEPSSLALLGTGTAGAFYSLRRRFMRALADLPSTLP